MFALRGIGMALASFAALYCLLSIVVVGAWRWVELVGETSPRSRANLLFLSRIFPLATSALITVVLVVPSFLEFEPHSRDEDFGIVPLLLGASAILLLAFGLLRVAVAQARTSRVVAEWLQGANSVNAGASAPTFQTSGPVPPLTLVGVYKPRVLVSDNTVALLSQDELQVALRHEMAHVRSYDNLKKLILRFSVFPGMAKLENAWSEAAELAADDAAVSNANEALDLAAALVKLSRLLPMGSIPQCSVALVDGSGSVRVRVARLLIWDETSTRSVRQPRWLALAPVVSALFFAAATYAPALSLTHQITEWLIR